MSAPAFSLELDDSAEVATVRPREGHHILVERFSPTEVVLRLRPVAGGLGVQPCAATAAPAASAPEPTEATDTAAVTASEAPHTDPEDTEAQPNGQEDGEQCAPVLGWIASVRAKAITSMQASAHSAACARCGARQLQHYGRAAVGSAVGGAACDSRLDGPRSRSRIGR
jgi:hypothetical protein